ncbi:MAG: DUF4372 domain-containing protein [Bryobacteraceae bacterium]
MHVGRFVFAQLMDHLPPHEFERCVARYKGNYKFRAFSCLDQFLPPAFAQLTFRASPGLGGMRCTVVLTVAGRGSTTSLFSAFHLPDRRGRLRGQEAGLAATITAKYSRTIIPERSQTSTTRFRCTIWSRWRRTWWPVGGP